ncbi:MAG: hypothetical protein ACR2RL_04590 [Gammaproteobacteria bacterium]
MGPGAIACGARQLAACNTLLARVAVGHDAPDLQEGIWCARDI